MSIRPIFALSVLSILLFSCRASRTFVSDNRTSASAEGYIARYADMAVREMKRTGVPASITLAQGMVESGFGNGELAVEANNHFGIKCHDDWDGPTIRHTDDRRNECFRKYRNPEDSFRDHSDFLRSTPRYSFLFDLDTKDYKGWARGLKKAGYATNPDYANMLIRNIETYGLDRFDSGIAASADTVLPREELADANEGTAGFRPEDNGYRSETNISVRALPERIRENNRIQYIIVGKNDTPECIEKEFKLLPWELKKYNELDDDFTLTPGQILYLQPKRKKAEPGKGIYISKPGDTMYTISQIYGIKLRELYMMNRMSEGSEPDEGQKIWLRSVKPVD
jgi:LysM repeat protein